MKEPHQEKEVLGFKMKRIVSEVERMANLDVSIHGLTFVQGKVILYLCENGGHCTQSEIEDYTETSHQASSGLLGRMEQKELVRCAFDGEDKRVKNVYITPKGESMYDTLVDVRHEYDSRLEHMLSENEKAVLYEMLDRVYNHLNDLDAE